MRPSSLSLDAAESQNDCSAGGHLIEHMAIEAAHLEALLWPESGSKSQQMHDTSLLYLRPIPLGFLTGQDWMDRHQMASLQHLNGRYTVSACGWKQSMSLLADCECTASGDLSIWSSFCPCPVGPLGHGHLCTYVKSHVELCALPCPAFLPREVALSPYGSIRVRDRSR